MKRLFTFMCIAAIAVMTQSCEGPAGPEGPMGPAGKSFSSITKDWSVASENGSTTLMIVISILLQKYPNLKKKSV